MRVLLVASPAHPTVARFTPTLATLAAQGCSIEACLLVSPELTREGILHLALEDSELDAALRSLTDSDLLIAPLVGPAALGAVAHVIGRGAGAPLLLVDANDAGTLLGRLPWRVMVEPLVRPSANG